MAKTRQVTSNSTRALMKIIFFIIIIIYDIKKEVINESSLRNFPHCYNQADISDKFLIEKYD